MERSEIPKSTWGNVMLVLSVFIIFILAFEERISVPVWLQPIGRMHPLLLHLPIVVVLLAMGLEFFRVKSTEGAFESVYDKLTRYLMFAGIILSGITIIMGLFLAQEGGYDTGKLLWHKWTGVLVFFLAVAIYHVRDRQWYEARLARVGSLATAATLVVAGHLGGSITHGEDFFLQPVASVSAPTAPPLEEARVFEHVIKPVFQNKCASCHNEQKKKGELLLTDSTAVRAGGKSGKLFITGNADSSLLLQRLHLSPDNKKHMPPRDKPQLTRQETALLHYWVKSGAQFSTRVLELSEEDTFRTLAIHKLESERMSGDAYDFPAVASHTLEKLNSNYRVIRPVSATSPALTVNVYDRNVYSPRTLEELKDVKEQVISLDVARMPVTDADLKHITRLHNLERLNLNFTEVTGTGLAALRSLERLAVLSITGTAMKYDALRQSLAQLRNLKSLAIWNTGLSEKDIEKLHKEFPGIKFLGESPDQTALMKLNPPRLKNKVKVFNDSIAPDLFHPVHGVDIRFTVDGTDPDSLTSERFRQQTTVTKSTVIRARAYKDGWLSSDVSILNVYKCALKPDTAILLTKLNRVHPANGAWTFFDQELGSFNANSPAWANNWAGFRMNDMELYMYYHSPKEVSSISLNTLIETENSIFPPTVIEVWGGSSENALTLIARKRIEVPQVYAKPYIQLFDVEFEKRTLSCLKIVAKPLMRLPAWHKNKDKPTLMLVDEVLVN